MSDVSTQHQTLNQRGEARAPVWRRVDFAAGVMLLLMAAFLGWFGQTLPGGTAYRMGPGYVPHLLAWIIGALGIVLCATAWRASAEALDRWPLRPMLLVLGGMAAFAFTIEPLGLLIASMLVVLLAGFAAPHPAVRGIVVLAVGLAAFACLLFPVALQLPLKVLP